MDKLSFFSERINDLLSEFDLTPKTLSELTGIRVSRINDYQNNKRVPILRNAVNIADAFRCPLDYLFGFIEDFVPTDYKICDTVGNRIVAAIDESGLSRYQLSEMTGISQPQLHRWYRKKQIPTPASLVTLAEALGRSLDDLAGREVVL